MSPVLRQDLLRSAPLLLPACGLSLFLLVVRLGGSLVVSGLPLEEAYPEWVLVALTAVAWLVVRELGVREWTERGHEAREALPLRPARAFLEKALFGAGLLLALAVVGAMLLSTALRLLRQPDPELPDLLLRGACAWLAAVYGLLWALAACGRHRHAVGTWLVLGLLGLDQAGVLAWDALPPLRLARDGLTGSPDTARDALLLGAGLLLLASAPWMLLRGRLTRAWSGPPTRVDLLAVGSGLLLLAGGAALGQAGPASPLRLEGAVAEAGPVRVRAPVAEDERRASQALATSTATTLAWLPDELGLPAPAVGVELARGQDGFLRAELRGRRGLLVRADWLDPAFPAAEFQAWLLRQALDEATSGRLRPAPWRWLLDGWPGWRAGPSPREPERGLRLACASAWLEEAGLLGPGLLARWDEVRGRLGEPLARELAGWVVAELAGAAGPAAPTRLLAGVTAARTGALAALRGGPGALGSLLRRQGGLELGAFEERLAGAARALARAQAQALAGCAPPRWEAFRLEPAPGPEGVRLRLEVPPPAQAGSGPVALLVAADAGELPERWDRGELYPGDEPLELGPWPPGTTLWVTWSRPSPALGLEQIAGWRRLELP